MGYFFLLLSLIIMIIIIQVKLSYFCQTVHTRASLNLQTLGNAMYNIHQIIEII